MACSYCGEKVFARGLCQACYYRLRRNGSLERRNVINSGKCSVGGCDNDAFAKNLCQHHYNRADHPLKATWKLLRSRHKGEYSETWDSFLSFIADVGPRPGGKYQLRRIDNSLPFSKENSVWLAPVGSDYRKGRWTGQEIKSYERAWRLRKKFGITAEEYDQRLAAQGGVCAICGNKESHRYSSGKLKELAVDHCHGTNKIRGLLCSLCNRGIGMFRHSPELLVKAIDYLKNPKRLI